MLAFKCGLRARIFADHYLDLATITASEVLLWRSGNAEQTDRAIELLRQKLPNIKIVLVVQREFANKFRVEEEILYHFGGSFKITIDSEGFFEMMRQRNFQLTLLIYNNLARQGYLEVEKCALACGSPITAGIFPDGGVIEIEKNIMRKRELAAILNQRLWEKLKNA